MLDGRRADRDPADPKPTRMLLARYGLAILLAIAGVVVDLLLGTILTGEPLYAVLVASVAVSVAYGGLGAGLTTIAAAWALALWLLVGPAGQLAVDDSDDLTRWAAGLAIAVGVIVLTEGLRRGRAGAAAAVAAAQATIRDVTALQDLTAATSAALTQADVAHALLERIPLLVGARGGAVGLVDGDDLVIVDARAGTAMTHRPGARIPLEARAPIVQAAVTGTTIVVRDRASFERTYPDGIALTPYARAAVAVPLRIAGEVVGAVSFLFDSDDAMTDDAEAVASIAADVGSQALERARLYDTEHESRRALDRILRASPAFHADTAEAVTEAICREARLAFGADLGMLWRVASRQLELVWCEPAAEALPPGLVAELDDFPQLRDAIGALAVSFVADVGDEALREGLERVQRLGIRSSLRIPVTVGDEARHLVVASWDSVVSEPEPSTILLARRLADQAGLALEQLERRLAQAEAARRADETRRLQEVTSALSLASSATDVSDTCLAHALEAVGADAGFVVLSRGGTAVVEMVSSNGYGEDEIEVWRAFDLDADVPVSRAYSSGEPVWALTGDEMASFTGVEAGTDRGWVTLPLRTSGGVRGVLQLGFRTARTLSDAERQWLQTVVSQCAQALERSLLFDEEQLLRERSERLLEMTSELSNALTRADVADAVVQGLGAALGADGTVLGVVADDRRVLRALAWQGLSDEHLGSRLELDLDGDDPGTDAIRRRTTTFYESFEELEARFPGISRDDVARHQSSLYVPLVAERRVIGLLVVSWADRRALSLEERRFVATLAGQAAQALERAGNFETEQTVAATLQRSVLPTTLPRVTGVQLAARYLPGTVELNVGGDWFDAFALDNGRIGLVVGDVVGKGVQAAATMAQLRNALRAFSLDRMKPSSMLGRLNRLAEEVLETAFATVVYAVVDPRGLVCRFTSAGHPPPLVLHPDGRAELLEGGRGLPLGTGATRYGQQTVELTSGAVLLLYTDGLVERRGESIDVGLAALLEAARTGPRDPEVLVEHVLGSMVGVAERADDIALLAVRVFAVAPEPLELRLPSETGSLDVVRDALRAWLDGTPAERAEAEDVVLAVWEACANAIEHARDPGGDTVSVRARHDDSRVRVVVEDSGRWAPPVESSGRGLGLQLIRSLDVLGGCRRRGRRNAGDAGEGAHRGRSGPDRLLTLAGVRRFPATGRRARAASGPGRAAPRGCCARTARRAAGRSGSQ